MQTKIENLQHARWAVYFRMLGIEYEYMPLPHIMPGGLIYQPTFLLPTFEGGAIARYEPEYPPKELTSKMMEIKTLADWLYCAEVRRKVIILFGDPDFKVLMYVSWDENGDIRRNLGLPNADEAQDENRMFAEPGYEELDGSIEPRNFQCLGANYVQAVRIARAYQNTF